MTEKKPRGKVDTSEETTALVAPTEEETLQRFTEERTKVQKEFDALQTQLAALDIEINVRLGGGTLEGLFEKFGENGAINPERSYRHGFENPVLTALKRVGWDTGYYGRLLAVAPALLLKWVRADGTPVMAQNADPWSMPILNQDGTWTPGEWREVEGTIVTCENGLHATNIKHLDNWRDNYEDPNHPMVLCQVEVEGPILQASGKYVARRMRLVRILNTPPNEAALRQQFLNENFEELKTGMVGLDQTDTLALTSNPSGWDEYRKKRIDELMAEDHDLQADSYRDPLHKRSNNQKRDALRAYRQRLDLMEFDVVDALARVRDISRDEAQQVFEDYVLQHLGL